MLRAAEMKEATGTVHPPWWDLIAVRSIYLVYGDHWILITSKETQPLWTPRGQIGARLIDARFLLSTNAPSQLTFPWVASPSWMLRPERRRLGIREGNSIRAGFPNPLGSLGNLSSAPCLLVSNKPLKKKDIKPQDLLLISPAS